MDTTKTGTNNYFERFEYIERKKKNGYDDKTVFLNV